VMRARGSEAAETTRARVASGGAAVVTSIGRLAGTESRWRVSTLISGDLKETR